MAIGSSGGGEVNNGVSNTVYSYLPSTNTWTLNARLNAATALPQGGGAMTTPTSRFT